MHIAKMTICYLKQITHLSNLSINTAITIIETNFETGNSIKIFFNKEND